MSHSTSLEKESTSAKEAYIHLFSLPYRNVVRISVWGRGDLSVFVKNVKHYANTKDYCYPLREKKPQIDLKYPNAE